MKQKTKIISKLKSPAFFIGLFVFLFAFAIFMTGSAKAQTAASGASCALASQCGDNQTCYQSSGDTGATCQPGTAGLPCTTDNNCITGESCSSSHVCVVATSFTSYSQCITNTTNLAANPKGTCCQYFPGDPACANLNNPTGGTTVTGGCPTGLNQVNGLCLPPNPYSTGVASQKTLTGLLRQVIQFLLDFAGIVSVVILIVGGFWYITSSGSEEQAEKGKKAIINAIIGLLVVILSYAIVTIISGTLTTNNFLAH